MALTFTDLYFTHGGVTVNLLGDDFALVEGGYAPVVAARDVGSLGHAVYPTVVDTMTINIYGADATAALANLHKLTDLLHASELWRHGRTETPVVLFMQMVGSNLPTPPQYIVTGAPDRRPMIELPATLNDTLYQGLIEGVVITFKRRGAGIGGFTSNTSNSPEAELPGPYTVTWAAAEPYPAPTELTITGFVDPAVEGVGGDTKAYLFMGNGTGKIDKVMGADATLLGGSGLSIATVAATTAPGGTVLQVTATDTNWGRMYWLNPGVAGRLVEVYGLFHLLDNVTWLAYVTDGAYTGAPPASIKELTETRVVEIPYGVGNPTVVRLGSLYAPDTSYGMFLNLRALDATGSPQLELSHLLAIDVTDGLSTVLEIQPNNADNPSEIIVDPKPFGRVPQVRTAYGYPMGYAGNAYLQTTEENVEVAIMAPVNNNWSWVQDGTTTKETVTVTGRRYAAYPTPG